MQRIFGDFEILKLVKDRLSPGVFLKARKPLSYSPNSLQDVALYSMILARRTTSIPKLQEIPLSRKVKLLAAKVMKNLRLYTRRGR
jgi:hypothetical protein